MRIPPGRRWSLRQFPLSRRLRRVRRFPARRGPQGPPLRRARQGSFSAAETVVRARLARRRTGFSAAGSAAASPTAGSAAAGSTSADSAFAAASASGVSGVPSDAAPAGVSTAVFRARERRAGAFLAAGAGSAVSPGPSVTVPAGAAASAPVVSNSGGLSCSLCRFRCDDRFASGPDRPLRCGGRCLLRRLCSILAGNGIVVNGYNLIIIHMWRHSCPWHAATSGARWGNHLSTPAGIDRSQLDTLRFAPSDGCGSPGGPATLFWDPLT